MRGLEGRVGDGRVYKSEIGAVAGGGGDVFFQAEDGIRDVERSRGLGDLYNGRCACYTCFCAC